MPSVIRKAAPTPGDLPTELLHSRCNSGIQRLQRRDGAGEPDQQVFQDPAHHAGDELLRRKSGVVDVGRAAPLHLQQLLPREAGHGGHDCGVGDTALAVERLEDLADGRSLARRARPHEFHDLRLEIAQDFPDARAIGTEHGDVRLKRHGCLRLPAPQGSLTPAPDSMLDCAVSMVLWSIVAARRQRV